MNGQKDDDSAWDCIVFFLVIWPIIWAWLIVKSWSEDTGFLVNLLCGLLGGFNAFYYAAILTGLCSLIGLCSLVVGFFKIVVEFFAEIFSTTKLEKKLEEEREKKLEEERKKKLEEERVKKLEEERKKKLEEERKKKLEEADRMRLQQETEFLYYLFSILAKMSKADGRVRAEEVNVIEKVFTQFEIAQRRREYCAHIFNIAKDKENSVYWYAEKFSSQVATPEICYFLYELLWDVACADGRLHPAEKEILQNICDCLNIPREYYNIIYRRRRATFIECDKEKAKRKSQSEEKKMRDWNRTYVSGKSPILEAYEILESESTATVEELKSAYRRIAKRYHPDLLQENGVPEEMIIKATEYMAQVNVAWKDIRNLRGF